MLWNEIKVRFFKLYLILKNIFVEYEKSKVYKQT